MKKTILVGLSSALLLIPLLSGCSQEVSNAVSSPTSSPEATPALEEPAAETSTVSLEEWVGELPISPPTFTFASSDLDLEDGINWPADGVTLNLGSWKGSLQEAADTAGITLDELMALNPDLDLSSSEDYFYELRIQEEPYLLPQVPVQEVTLEMPWLTMRNERTFSCRVPADLDRQAAAVMAAAYSFLREHNGVHFGIDPSTYHEDGFFYTTQEGALCTTYTQLEQYLSCIFTPEYYEDILGGPLPDGQLEASTYYQGENDTINFMMGDRGGSLSHCGTLFTQPEIQEDGSILFWQLSLRLDLDEYNGFNEGQTYTPIAADASRVRLVPTDAGWRVAELTLPY